MARYKCVVHAALIAAVLGVALSSCGYGSIYNVTKPTEVTVDEAITSVGRGIAGMKRELQAGGIKQAGLLVDEVTVTFNVSADAQRTGKLVLDASAPIMIGESNGSLKANGETTSSDKAARSNQVTIKLKNWYTAQLNAQGTKQSERPDDVLIDPTDIGRRGR